MCNLHIPIHTITSDTHRSKMEPCINYEQQFETRYKATILESYVGVDFSKIPPEIGEAFERKDLPYLGRFVNAISCYDVFAVTYEQKTTRSIHMRDQFDLVAYMMKNSKIQVPLPEEPLIFALDYIDSHTDTPTKSVLPIDPETVVVEDTTIIPSPLSQFITTCQEEKQKMYDRQLIIHSYLHEQFSESLNEISNFVAKHKKELTEDKPFITERYNYELYSALYFFEQLPVADQLEIATNKWKEVDLLRCSTTYILVIKLLYEITLDRELAKRHPYLLARRADMMDVVEMISEEADEDDARMRMLAYVFAAVSGIDIGELVSKCLLFMGNLQRGTTFFD
jgi:hypothetical protein